MTDKWVTLSQSDAVATVTIDRPEALNALNATVLTKLSECMTTVAENASIRVLVITGGGEKAFVAGADISELATLSPLAAKRVARSGQAAFNKIQHLPIPVIAAVNGYALGGGSELALACDMIVAADSARFGLPEITLGLIPGFGGTQRLARRIGIARAKEMIFTGKMISASEAAGMGWINAVVPDADLMSHVQEMAKTIAAKGMTAIRAAKAVINTGLDTDLGSACELEADAFALCMASADAKEGTRAFLEKRPAVFNADLDGNMP